MCLFLFSRIFAFVFAVVVSRSRPNVLSAAALEAFTFLTRQEAKLFSDNLCV